MMRVLRLMSILVVVTVVTGMSPGQDLSYPSLRVAAPASDTGVFGLQQDYWDDQLGDSHETPAGDFHYGQDTGEEVFVRFDRDGYTAYVEYLTDSSLSESDAESFIQGLLPSDTESLGQHEDLLGNGGGEPVTVYLYFSNAVQQQLSGYSGIILFAFRQDGSNFSLSILASD